ncbi:MAG: RNA polymerase sigma factor RpoH [Rickettsiales bacterium]|nr:RNA polymerase sigma factor RpoH [Rickettsiales bacterium]
MKALALPELSPENGLQKYLSEIRKFPVLEHDEEFMLSKRWLEHGDNSAAHKLVTSHLRLVAKIAMGYRGYGLPVGELIAEGNIGLMQAVKRFDPDRGFRLSTYAIWWIKATIQEYVLRSWSLVKMGTSAAQKRLFFNLRKLKRKLEIVTEGDMSDAQVQEIAAQLNVHAQDVIDMDRRMTASDQHLNAVAGADSKQEWIDLLEDQSDNQEVVLAANEEMAQKRGLLQRAMALLNPRERDIIEKRRLSEEPSTLEDLSVTYNISRERVRQIEMRAMEKLADQMVGERDRWSDAA